MTTGSDTAHMLESRREIKTAGDGGPPMPVAVGDIEGQLHTMRSAGHTYLWKRDDRERSVFNDNALTAKLAERFPADHPTMAGQFAWTSVEPSEPAARGTTMCWLHPGRPERARYDAMGYPVCESAHFINEYDAGLHTEHKHRATFRMIKEVQDQERVNQTSQANVNVMTMLAEAIAGQAITVPAQPVADAPVEEATAEEAGSIWDFTGAGTTDTVEPGPHAHRYGKSGAPQCKVVGCSVMRQVPFSRRKRR